MKNISKEILLTVNEALAKQLEEMGDFLKPFPAFWQNYRLCLSFARDTIQKTVPASWFLKKVLIYMSAVILSNPKDYPDNKNVLKKIVKMTKNNKIDVNNPETLSDCLKENPHILMQKIHHFYSYEDRRIRDAIDGYQYGDKDSEIVFNDLEEIVDSLIDPNESFYLDEEEEKEEAGTDGYKIEDYISFPDGWKWVWKHTDKSEIEHKYGSHCGNCGDPTHEFLSLREPMEKKGKWKIWASFSIDSEGYLVQRKGVVEIVNPTSGRLKKRQGNTRPEERLHPYIYALLKIGNERGDIVGLTSGSGYAHEEDFVLEDLPEDQRKELYGVLEEKEFFESIYDEFEANGFTDRIMSEIESDMNVQLSRVEGKYWISVGEMPYGILDEISEMAGDFYYPEFEDSFGDFEDNLDKFMASEDEDLFYSDFKDSLDDGADCLTFLENIWHLTLYNRQSLLEKLKNSHSDSAIDFSNVEDLFSDDYRDLGRKHTHIEDLFVRNKRVFKSFFEFVKHNLDGYRDYIPYAIVQISGDIGLHEEGGETVVIVDPETIIGANIEDEAGDFFRNMSSGADIIILYAIFRHDILHSGNRNVYNMHNRGRLFSSDLTWDDVEEEFYKMFYHKRILPLL